MSIVLQVTTDLRQQLQESEAEFEAINSHLEGKDKKIAKRDATVVRLKDQAKLIEKDLDACKTKNRRLEALLAEAKPATVEVALSAREYEEVDALRLRDRMIKDKNDELWMVEEQRAELVRQLDMVETEVERMQEDLVTKDILLSKEKSLVDKLQREMKQLHAVVKKAEGMLL